MKAALGTVVLASLLASSQGCGMAHPRTFRRIVHPSPMVRARALSLGDGKPSAQVVPALVGRLEDDDPVVRLAAHEELKKRTGRDFGYVPWDEEPTRAEAVGRWRDWLSGKAPEAAPSPQATATATPQVQPTSQIRRTIPY